MNVLVEGLEVADDEDPYELALNILNAMELPLERKDLPSVRRIPRRNPRITTPPPLVISFSEIWMRDSLVFSKNLC